ncbi:hypothetical protein OSTOST_06465 [Ostertagia ostertagi]
MLREEKDDGSGRMRKEMCRWPKAACCVDRAVRECVDSAVILFHIETPPFNGGAAVADWMPLRLIEQILRAPTYLQAQHITAHRLNEVFTGLSLFS